MSTFHLIAPSGYCINQRAAALAVERLTREGHQVNNQQVITRREERFAGSEAERLADINDLARLAGENLIVMLYSGILAQQRALILGSFSHAQPNDYDAGYTLEKMVAWLRSRVAIPVIAGLDFGHEAKTVTLPLGAHAILQHAEKSTLTLTGHPTISA